MQALGLLHQAMRSAHLLLHVDPRCVDDPLQLVAKHGTLRKAAQRREIHAKGSTRKMHCLPSFIRRPINLQNPEFEAGLTSNVRYPISSCAILSGGVQCTCKTISGGRSIIQIRTKMGASVLIGNLFGWAFGFGFPEQYAATRGFALSTAAL